MTDKEVIDELVCTLKCVRMVAIRLNKNLETELGQVVIASELEYIVDIITNVHQKTALETFELWEKPIIC